MRTSPCSLRPANHPHLSTSPPYVPLSRTAHTFPRLITCPCGRHSLRLALQTLTRRETVRVPDKSCPVPWPLEGKRAMCAQAAPNYFSRIPRIFVDPVPQSSPPKGGNLGFREAFGEKSEAKRKKCHLNSLDHPPPRGNCITYRSNDFLPPGHAFISARSPPILAQLLPPPLLPLPVTDKWDARAANYRPAIRFRHFSRCFPCRLRAWLHHSPPRLRRASPRHVLLGALEIGDDRWNNKW